MKRSPMKIGLAAVLAAGIGLAAWGASAQDKEAVYKDRKALMKQQAASMKAIKDYLDGKGEQSAVVPAAETLVKDSKMIPEHFPKGTGMDAIKDSEAKPVIWQDWDKFLAAQKNLVGESEKLLTVAKSGDKAKLQEQFVATGKEGCGGCHNTFRQKKT
jgi:cytochrome c556